MRYALVSDIHANWPAWCAVRDDLRAQQVDAVVCLGDVVGYGPSPQRVLADVRQYCDQLLLGNHEAAALGRLDLSIFNDAARRAAEWTATQLDAESKTFLNQLPMVAEDEDLLFVHADPVAPEGWGYVETCKDAEACLAATTQRLIFVGHTHLPEVYVRRPSGVMAQLPPTSLTLEAGARYLVNVGSGGEPRDGSALATYCIYDSTAQRLDFRRLAFDLAALRAELKLQPQLDLPWFLQEHAPDAGAEKRERAIRVAKVATTPIRVTANRVRIQVGRNQRLQAAPTVVTPAKPMIMPVDAAAARQRRTIRVAAFFFTAAAILFIIAAVVYVWPSSEAPALAVVTAPPPPAAAVNAPAAPRPSVLRAPQVIVLSAQKAVLKGKLRLERRGNEPPHIAYWNQMQDTVSWKLDVGRAGRYTVSMVYGLEPRAGAVGGLAVSCGKDWLLYQPHATGSWYTFETVTLGELELPAGVCAVVVQPNGKIKGGLLNLRELRLQPVGG